MRLLPSISILLLAASASAQAHGELPTAEWCSNGRAVEVASFRLEPAALERETDATCSSASTTSGASTTKTCGQFDDDYGTGLKAAQRHCGQFARAWATRADPDLGSTSPLIAGPKEFLDPAHHELYRLNLGVEGICLRCEAAAVQRVEERSSTARSRDSSCSRCPGSNGHSASTK